MAIFIENKEEFDKILKKEKIVLCDFFATWCGPCKMLAPILEEYAEMHPEIKVIKVDVDKVGELARHFGIMSIPTLIVFKDGEAKDQALGFMPLDELTDFVNGAI